MATNVHVTVGHPLMINPPVAELGTIQCDDGAQIIFTGSGTLIVGNLESSGTASIIADGPAGHRGAPGQPGGQGGPGANGGNGFNIVINAAQVSGGWILSVKGGAGGNAGNGGPGIPPNGDGGDGGHAGSGGYGGNITLAFQTQSPGTQFVPQVNGGAGGAGGLGGEPAGNGRPGTPSAPGARGGQGTFKILG